MNYESYRAGFLKGNKQGIGCTEDEIREFYVQWASQLVHLVYEGDRLVSAFSYPPEVQEGQTIKIVKLDG